MIHYSQYLSYTLAHNLPNFLDPNHVLETLIFPLGGVGGGGHDGDVEDKMRLAPDKISSGITL